jgi:hypothetical protein
MRKNLIKIYFFCSEAFSTCISLISVLLFSSFSVYNNINKRKFEIKKNTDCIIIGNGPSASAILKQNKEFLQKDLFVLNFFGLTSYFKSTRPAFYILIDHDFFSENGNLDLMSNVKDLIIELNQVSWKMMLFVPLRYSKSRVMNNLTNPNLIITPINTTPISGFEKVEYFIFKKQLGMPVAESVIIAAIFLAINFQYKTCHLFGVEHSWLKNLQINHNNEVLVGLDHFYEGSSLTDENRGLSEFLLSQARLFRSHMKLQKFSQYQGVKILNHTSGSYIDAYQKAIFMDFLQ